MNFRKQLDVLIDCIEGPDHHGAIAKLRRCRRVRDLDALASDDLGWLEPSGRNPRLRLVKHGSGTFLILSYDDGWGTTLGQAGFSR